MAEQPISLDGADGVSPGAPNANAEGGDPVGEAVAPPFLFGRAVVAGFFFSIWRRARKVGAVCGAGVHPMNRQSLCRIVAFGPSSRFLVYYFMSLFFFVETVCLSYQV